MAADLYLKEVDSLRFELSMNHASDEVMQMAADITCRQQGGGADDRSVPSCERHPPQSARPTRWPCLHWCSAHAELVPRLCSGRPPKRNAGARSLPPPAIAAVYRAVGSGGGLTGSSSARELLPQNSDLNFGDLQV